MCCMYLPFHHILLFPIWLNDYNNHVQSLPFSTLTSGKTLMFGTRINMREFLRSRWLQYLYNCKTLYMHNICTIWNFLNLCQIRETGWILLKRNEIVSLWYFLHFMSISLIVLETYTSVFTYSPIQISRRILLDLKSTLGKECLSWKETIPHAKNKGITKPYTVYSITELLSGCFSYH